MKMFTRRREIEPRREVNTIRRRKVPEATSGPAPTLAGRFPVSTAQLPPQTAVAHDQPPVTSGSAAPDPRTQRATLSASTPLKRQAFERKRLTAGTGKGCNCA